MNNELLNVITQLGIGGIGMYLMYKIVLYVIRNNIKQLIQQIEKQTNAIDKLALKIERIDTKINNISKKIEENNRR